MDAVDQAQVFMLARQTLYPISHLFAFESHTQFTKLVQRYGSGHKKEAKGDWNLSSRSSPVIHRTFEASLGYMRHGEKIGEGPFFAWALKEAGRCLITQYPNAFGLSALCSALYIDPAAPPPPQKPRISLLPKGQPSSPLNAPATLPPSKYHPCSVLLAH